jgi:hypothetical protein
MTGGDPPKEGPSAPGDGHDHTTPTVYGPDDEPDGVVPDTTSAILGRARTRLVAHPRAFLALVFAGAAVAGIDWVQFHDAVPTTAYEGIQQGRVAATFRVIVAPESRATVPAGAFLHLRPAWLARTVGLVLGKYAAVVLASGYALARLLDVALDATALARYGAVVALLWVGVGRFTFEGGAVLLGLPLLIAFFYVAVRLVPLPARLLRGESLRTALGRSWGQTDGHGWALFGVVLVVGVATHLTTSVPVVGPVGSGAVAALHAAVAAVACEAWPVREGDGADETAAVAAD